MIAAWGEHAQWVRNLAAARAISVQIGCARWPVPEHRVLDVEGTTEVIAVYRREHPFAARLIGRMLGWPADSAGPVYEQFVQAPCAVAFRPSAVAE